MTMKKIMAVIVALEQYPMEDVVIAVAPEEQFVLWD